MTKNAVKNKTRYRYLNCGPWKVYIYLLVHNIKMVADPWCTITWTLYYYIAYLCLKKNRSLWENYKILLPKNTAQNASLTDVQINIKLIFHRLPYVLYSRQEKFKSSGIWYTKLDYCAFQFNVKSLMFKSEFRRQLYLHSPPLLNSSLARGRIGVFCRPRKYESNRSLNRKYNFFTPKNGIFFAF